MSATKKITVEVEVEVPAELEFERRAKYGLPEEGNHYLTTGGEHVIAEDDRSFRRIILTAKPTYADLVREWWPEEVTGFACVAVDEGGAAFFYEEDACKDERGGIWNKANGDERSCDVAAIITALNLPPFPPCDNWRESKVCNPHRESQSC